MRIRTNYQRWAVSLLGMLSLLATLGSAAPRNWQNTQAGTDVSLTVAADRSMLKNGQDVTYSIAMTNLGPDDATFVDVDIAIPDSLRVVSITCDLGISPDGPFCEYSSLPAGATVVSTLIATPQPSATRVRLLTVSASVLFENADAFDPDTNNNAASVQTKLIGRLP